MKVMLFSTQWPEYMIELANAMVKRRDTILVLPSNHRFTARHGELIDGRVKFENFEVLFHRSIRDNVKMLWRILRIVWKYKPGILHIQANGHRLFYWIFFFKPLGTRIVNTIHDPKKHAGDKISGAINDRWAIFFGKLFTSKYIVHGEYLKRQLCEVYKISAEKVSVIPHGHLEIYKKFQSEHFEENPSQVLFFGRIWEYKGLDFFIRCGNIVAKRLPHVKFLIVGQGENIDKYSRMIEMPFNFQIINRRVSIADAGEFFETSAIVVLPYIEGTQSGVLPVAYAYGKPVVATRVGSMAEVVMDGKTGFLVKPKSAEELAERVLQLLQDQKLRKQLGANAYKFCHTSLSWDLIADKTQKVYLVIQ